MHTCILHGYMYTRTFSTVASGGAGSGDCPLLAA